MTGPLGTPPVLAEAHHIQIVPGHWEIDMHNAVAPGPQTATELRFFAGNKAWIVSFDFCKGAQPHHHVSATILRDPCRIDPVKVEDPVI
jgi:hypothetical protein